MMTSKVKQEARTVAVENARLLLNTTPKYFVSYKLSNGLWSSERQCTYLDWLRYKFDPTCITRVEEVE
jgi:hypothetical protein